MTLPSRLRPHDSKRGLLADMESILNVNGNQRIASLQCSILNSSRPNGSDRAFRPGSDDQRVPGSNTRNAPGEDDLQETSASFDVDLSAGETARPTLTSAHARAKEHTFARVESLRDGARQERVINGEEDGLARKRRRLAGMPIVERSVKYIQVSDGKDTGTTKGQMCSTRDKVPLHMHELVS